ncbi:hypothetical protein [Companilactobacillus zhongbaensis]|uniref:hypothetical protein n=1 Tax=Companilactobacillus zhongbaensis TaxID=2486009 RepID=UPI000F78A325|nr:hypothetical protein [Companilactobacillus zhongbaensis]
MSEWTLIDAILTIAQWSLLVAVYKLFQNKRQKRDDSANNSMTQFAIIILIGLFFALLTVNLSRLYH